MNNKILLLVLTAFLLLGAGLMLWAGAVSLHETGERSGSRLPTHVIALGAIGLFLLVFTIFGFLAVAILNFTEWEPVNRILHAEVLPDDHMLAKVGKGILRAHRAWELLVAFTLLAVLVAGGFYVGGFAGWIVVGLVVVFLGLVLYGRHTRPADEPDDSTLP